MSRVLALVEGATERAFVDLLLAQELSQIGVYIRARIVGKPGHKGGVRPYASVRNELLALLKEDGRCHVTMMFDYYGLPTDWPGSELRGHQASAAVVQQMELQIHADICTQMGQSFDPSRFVPYLQLHEFEAVLFSGPAPLAETVQDPALESEFRAIVDECGEPELIDDGPETCPSKRIAAIAPSYQKTFHGPVAAKRIGLSAMRQSCPHFDEWVFRLEGFSE